MSDKASGVSGGRRVNNDSGRSLPTTATSTPMPQVKPPKQTTGGGGSSGGEKKK